MWDDKSNLSKMLEDSVNQEKDHELKKLRSTYLAPSLAIFLTVLVLWLVTWVYLFFNSELSKYKNDYNQKFTKLKTERTTEVNNEVKQIVIKMNEWSKLVYNLSMFHNSPVDIIEKIEKAIYLGKSRVVTNQSVKISNYTEISFAVTTDDITVFVDLIKKLKKLYSDQFSITWMTDFSITREEDEEGNLTGKVFYKTDITLKYLKDPGTNLLSSGGQNIWENLQSEKAKYENNSNAYTTFSDLVKGLAEKRKSEGKRDGYISNTPSDDSMFGRTDFEYSYVDPKTKQTEKYGIYYITPTNSMADLFQLHGIWTPADYSNLKKENVKLIFLTNETGTKYGLCTKIEKSEDKLSDLEKEDSTKLYTEVLSEGTMDETIKSFCELL